MNACIYQYSVVLVVLVVVVVVLVLMMNNKIKKVLKKSLQFLKCLILYIQMI